MKLFVATPMYGGQCYGAYTASMMSLARLCPELEYFPLFNESHIDRARNVCVEHFLRSQCDKLFFIDSDISFRAIDATHLASSSEPIICGFYPKKEIDWKRVSDAVKLGYKPEDLERFATQLVYTPAPNSDAARSIYDLVEIHEGGTGFMCIHREVFIRITEWHPELCYPTKLGTTTCFFDAKLSDDHLHKRFLSEDYDFCRLARGVGYKIMLAPWIKLIHHGYYRWIGDVEALSKVALGEAA